MIEEEVKKFLEENPKPWEVGFGYGMYYVSGPKGEVDLKEMLKYIEHLEKNQK